MATETVPPSEPDPVTVTAAPIPSYNARWRHRDKPSRWSLIHWFYNGVPVCGTAGPGPDCVMDLPPEPVLTCRTCRRQHRLGWRPSDA